PWRPDRPAGGRGLRDRSLPRLPRLLRGFQHGASADRGGDRRADAAVQAHRQAARGRAGRRAVTGSQKWRRDRARRGMRICRDKALTTRDRMRVDVVSEFYVRVQAAAAAIASAAQTLGQRTTQPEALKELLEGKFVDALRTVAAEMTMEELHEKRGEYIRRVRETVAENLLQNGLELESASLTQLDQTAMEFFNPSNAFDAEGLARLPEQNERREQSRHDL